MTYVLLGILGLALLMVVHEGGHYLSARAFKMRVLRFSIGFGPALIRHQPKGSPTTFQVALIPFLAYVQIDGMNPFEEIDPDDEGSYANASLFGRMSTILAGPLANYLFASVLFFAALLIGGREVPTQKVFVLPDSPAAAAQMKDGDEIVAVAGEKIEDWEQMRDRIAENPGKALDIEIIREGEHMTLLVTPKATDAGIGRIGVGPETKLVPVATKEATVLAIKQPARVVTGVMVGIGRMITGQEKPDLAGPVGIVNETAKQIALGSANGLWFLGVLSAYLGAFNMLPIPALDGGRFMFLLYEATTRRRPNAKIEAQVHAVGLIMMLALIAAVTIFSDIPGRGN